MGRKVFLSFLGTGNYKQCTYQSDILGRSKVVDFVQEAICELACKNFQKDDCALIFLTRDAERKHWQSLKSRLEVFNFRIQPIKNMPEGYSEKEIWDIFNLVFKEIKKGDEVILDITHGFRSLPMLGMVLVNYARSLKEIKISSIHYGAFEALGPAHDIEKKIPNPSERVAPLLDLTAFAAIQAWTFGAESFIRTGRSQIVTKLSLENITPILSSSAGSDKTASSIRNLMNALSRIESAITTNRGKIINEDNNINTALSELDTLFQNDENVFTLIKPILHQIRQKLSNFQTMDHWEASVQWCIDHGLIQQGITQLQEGIISYVCTSNNLNPAVLNDREIVAQALNIFDKDITESEWHDPASNNKEKVNEIIRSDFVRKHKSNFSRLSTIRNDINHGGYKKDALNDGNKFKGKLDSIFKEFLAIKNK